MLWPVVLGRGAHLIPKEFLYLYRHVRYGGLRAFQSRIGNFVDTPNILTNLGTCEPSFFFVSGLKWELPESH